MCAVHCLKQDLLDSKIFRSGPPFWLKPHFVELPKYWLKLHKVCGTKPPRIVNHPYLIINDTLLQWKGCRIWEKIVLKSRLQIVRKRLNRIQSKFRASPSNTTPARFFAKCQEELHKTGQTLYPPAPNRANQLFVLRELIPFLKIYIALTAL